MIGTDENIPTMDILELYEKETGEKSTWEWHGRSIVTDDVIDWIWVKFLALDKHNKHVKNVIKMMANQHLTGEMNHKEYGEFDAVSIYNTMVMLSRCAIKEL